MSVKVAINGFGRIGRNILRASVENKRKDIEEPLKKIDFRAKQGKQTAKGCLPMCAM